MLQQVAFAAWSGCHASAAFAASILLHFMLSAWADGAYVQYFSHLHGHGADAVAYFQAAVIPEREMQVF